MLAIITTTYRESAGSYQERGRTQNNAKFR